jgi:H+/gluconate symporter-like permease
MNLLLIIAVMIAITWIVYASFRRLTVLISAPIATLIVVVLGRFDIIDSLFGSKGSYIFFLTAFIFNFFFIFILGSVMAKYLQKSGAIDTITQSVVKVIDIHNPMHGMIAVYLITALLTYGGVSLFVVMFAVVPLAKSLFSHMRIPWKLSPVPIILGLGTFTASMLPGSPSVINIIPTYTLNTTLMAAPLIGIIASVVTVISSIFYMSIIVESEIKRNGKTERADLLQQNIHKRPTLLLSLLPLVSLITIIIVGSWLRIDQILIIALLVVILQEMFLFRHYVSSHIEIINTGTIDALAPLLSTASTIAFGQLVANIGTIADYTRRIISQSSSKLLMAAVITIIFSVITGSGSGAIGIMVPAHGSFLLSTGISAEIIHRILSISSTIMPNTPHSGVVIALLSLSNLSHKESFKHVFLAPTLTGILALITAFLLSSFLL